MNKEQIDALERLARLRASGALSEPEYEAQKARLLASGDAPASRNRLLMAAAAIAVIGGTAVAMGTFRGEEPTGVEAATAAPAPAPPEAATPTPTAAAPARKGPPPLTAYAGAVSFDKVQGVSLLDHPRFRKIVQEGAPAELAATILDPNQVTTPVEMNATTIHYSACEPHNCGSHNWSVQIDRSTDIATICHFVEGEGATVYSEGRADIADSCPSGLDG